MAYSNGIGISFLAIGLAVGCCSEAADLSQTRDISITLASDGEHCIVRDVTIRCSVLAAHLRDTLKLPKETIIRLRAGRAVPYESVRKTLDIIERSGFNYPAALPVVP